MGATSGIVQVGDGTLPGLLALIPDPDTRESPTPREFGSMLDEMSPMAAAQLRVEIAAIMDDEGGGAGVTAFGSHTVTAGEATANEIVIDTGLTTAATLSDLVVSIERAGASVKADAVVTDNDDGTFTISEDTTYAVTAGDTVTWAARV